MSAARVNMQGRTVARHSVDDQIDARMETNLWC